MGKKGISLIVLMITLIVMGTLAFTVIISLSDSTEEVKETGFATELKEILEASQAYYLQHGKLPVASNVSYTKTELLGISNNAQALQFEFDMNNDTSEHYYKINLSKLAKSGSLYGNNKNEYDFYVISENCEFVYYPFGVNINGDVYFSLTNRLLQLNDVQVVDSVSGAVTSSNISNKINVSKSIENWTNSIDLTINTKLNSGEKLYYIIGSVKTQITGSMPYTLTLSNSNISSTLASEMTTNENIILQKENSSGKVIAKTTTNLRNLDISAPTIGTTTVREYSNYISVEFAKASDDRSGIKASYYTTSQTTQTASQLLSSGNVGDLYNIKLPTNSTYVQFVLVDNAGNVTDVKRISIN